MPIILGIDPGSRHTGFGVLLDEQQRLTRLTSGVINTTGETLPERLAEIYTGLRVVIEQYQPTEVSIEQVFVANNYNSALKLGQARGAAIVAASSQGLQVWEYSAKQIKQAVAGFGGADKQQMQHMVRCFLQLDFMPKTDEADALGAAWCHSQLRANRLLQLTAARTSTTKSGALSGRKYRRRYR